MLESNGGLLASWSSGTSNADFTVAQDGSGTHKTITEAIDALDAMDNNRPSRPIIYVKSGVYNEKVDIGINLPKLLSLATKMSFRVIQLLAQSHLVRLVYFFPIVTGMFYFLISFLFKTDVSGDGFWARDMTFENTAGPSGHQAVALRVSSDLSVFYKCSFKGYQDTLLVHSNRQFYRDCHIYGTIDFIFGDASVVFQNCDIFIRRPMGYQANFITAQGTDDPN